MSNCERPRPLRVLVACEYSGRVRDAFLSLGHQAMSCDLLETETPGPHYQGDARDLLDQEWDLLISFPPCTHLSAAGACHWPTKQADGRQKAAAEFFLSLYNAPVPKVCVENPAGWMNTNWRKPDQIIDPFQFGDPWKKRTCLWLKGLRPLRATKIVEPIGHWVGGQRLGKDRVYTPGNGRHRNPHMRSLTFQGIANAMAEQWGGRIS